jgi:membrane-associated phospholipid phosphatase
MPLSPHYGWAFVSAFGGAAVTLPAALLLAGWLSFLFGGRVAGHWLLLIAGVVGTTIITKLAFLGWGIGIRRIDFTGVSGHTALGTAVFPVLCYVSVVWASRTVRITVFAAGLLFALMIGVSRFPLNAHPISEIVAGYLLGTLVSVSFIRMLWKRAPLRAAPYYLIGVTLFALVFALHGNRVPSQHWLIQAALKLSGRERPFIRVRWKKDLYASVAPVKLSP